MFWGSAGQFSVELNRCVILSSLFKKLQPLTVVDFFNRINLLYGTVADSCTAHTCPTMSGGAKYEYLWQDGQDFKKPTPLPASTYIGLLMDWIEVRINDETVRSFLQAILSLKNPFHRFSPLTPQYHFRATSRNYAKRFSRDCSASSCMSTSTTLSVWCKLER